MGHLALVISGVVAIVAAFLSYPPPKPSKEMWDWVKSGDYFNHRGHSIFYKGRWSQGTFCAKSHYPPGNHLARHF